LRKCNYFLISLKLNINQIVAKTTGIRIPYLSPIKKVIVATRAQDQSQTDSKSIDE